MKKIPYSILSEKELEQIAGGENPNELYACNLFAAPGEAHLFWREDLSGITLEEGNYLLISNDTNHVLGVYKNKEDLNNAVSKLKETNPDICCNDWGWLGEYGLNEYKRLQLGLFPMHHFGNKLYHI